MGTTGVADLTRSKGILFARQYFRPTREAERVVVAAVCYRFRADGELEFLLIRTGAGRWTFPKGGVDDDPSAAAAAAREAYEEAGVIGRVQRSPFTRYLHRKNSRGTHLVHAHLCEVTHIGPSVEEHRLPTWFSPDKAKRRLREDRPVPLGEELEGVIEAAVRHLNSSRHFRGR